MIVTNAPPPGGSFKQLSRKSIKIPHRATHMVIFCTRVWHHSALWLIFYQPLVHKETAWFTTSPLLMTICFIAHHDDVIKWKHFPRYWPFVRGIHRSRWIPRTKGQWRGALIFSLICAWINDWVNNRETGDLKRHCDHYDVIIMCRAWAHVMVERACQRIRDAIITSSLRQNDVATYRSIYLQISRVNRLHLIHIFGRIYLICILHFSQSM